MSIGWVAGTARARAMTARRLGREGARRLAMSGSMAAALQTLASGPYAGRVHEHDSLEAAQRGAVAAALWNCRVLAGWVPRDGVTMLRVLAGAVEAANVVDHVRHLAGADVPAPLPLGALATSWSRMAVATSVEDVRRTLGASPWGDPGSTNAAEIATALRLSLADRVVAAVPDARTWASGSVALLLARNMAQHTPLSPTAIRSAGRVLGSAAAGATTIEGLRAALPTTARWALDDVTDLAELWRAEGRWWARVDEEATRLTRGAAPGPAVLLGAVTMLAVDAWRVRAALEVAARGPLAMEVFDEVA